MKRFLTVATCLAVAFVLAAPAEAQRGDEGPPGPVIAQGPSAHELDPLRPLPRPIQRTAQFQSDEMQLVGFTQEVVTGDAGVLNMSLICQREFRGSRMCTLNEINRSIIIPDSLGPGFAWVQNISRDDNQPTLNCQGWMSASSENVGTTIELGQCYGGMAMNTCDSRLVVACCATSGPMFVR